MNVDQPDTTTTCEVCLDGDGPWVRAELGLGARSMLIQPIEGDGGAVWVPYVDVRQLDEIDRSPTAAPGVRHLEIGLRDGRRPQVVLQSSAVEGLLAALATAQSEPTQEPPRPAEFDIGGPPPTLASPSAPPPSPVDVSAPAASPFSPLDLAPQPEHTVPAPSATSPVFPDSSAPRDGPDDERLGSGRCRQRGVVLSSQRNDHRRRTPGTHRSGRARVHRVHRRRLRRCRHARCTSSPAPTTTSAPIDIAARAIRTLRCAVGDRARGHAGRPPTRAGRSTSTSRCATWAKRTSPRMTCWSR